VAPTFQCIRCKVSITSTEQLYLNVNRVIIPNHRADRETLERLVLDLKSDVTESKRELKNVSTMKMSVEEEKNCTQYPAG